jgi:hypothetical protein
MKRSLLYLSFALLLPLQALAQGSVYLVIGSDTGIWEGLDVSRYVCTFLPGLYTDPTRNASRVMDPAFRSGLVDSYGTPMKLTWWMMAGNLFRYATNANIPHPNTMTFHLMQKYHGAAIRQWGDEITFHYHTWVWTDYNGDGKWYWNQATTWPETAADFDETLAEILLNEKIFPVSFRSGWHAMDNDWQRRLDSILPYSLHNDYPAKRTQTDEPIDNVYDWSRAPSTWIPFHPSPLDYQVPGPGPGWNVRSRYMSVADSAFMAKIFAEAANGTDQVVCLWAHLPETDFPDNLQKVNTSAHKVAPLFPGVQFRYCTAVEAMQAWRKSADTTRPTVTLEESIEGTSVRWTIRTDEPLFQPEPVVAVKDRYEQYRLLPCIQLGSHEWQTAEAMPQEDVALVGVAATDTAGNCALAFLHPLPEEIFVDDEDTSRVRATGSWTVSQTASWGRTSRQTTLHAGETVSFRWTPEFQHSALYNVFVQVPAVSNQAQTRVFRLLQGETVTDSILFTQPLPAGTWVYIATRLLSPGDGHSLEMALSGTGQDGLQAAADVVRYSPLVRTRWLIAAANCDAGEVIAEETNRRSFVIQNQGIETVTLSGFSSSGGITSLEDPLPLTGPSMGSRTITLLIQPTGAGPVVDTLAITSDDPRHVQTLIAVSGIAREYFTIVDDRDSLAYSETGTWSFSNARAYGTTSRYAYPAANVSATFAASPKKAGLYEMLSIVPTTVNASPRARYLLSVNGVGVDSVFLDQNAGSGAWVPLFQDLIPAAAQARVVITDAQETPASGKVLRADAIRFQWLQDDPAAIRIDERAPTSFALSQNYPNPFNPATVIGFDVPGTVQGQGETTVRLAVYDLLGREVALLANEKRAPGRYKVRFDASGLATGVYLCRLSAGSYVRSMRMLLLR